MSLRLYLVATLAALTLAEPLAAQPNPVRREIIQQLSFPAPGYNSVLMKIVVDKGGETAAHTHPGIELGYVAEGQAMLVITGQPSRTVSAGMSFSVPVAVVHHVQNVGTGPLTVISTYVVEKDKPIVIPAPQD